MGKIHNLKYSCLISIVLFLFMSGAKGYAAGIIDDWEPFTIKEELGLHAVGVGTDKRVFSPEEYTKMENALNSERDTTFKKNDNPWNIFKFRNLKISITHTKIDQLQRDVKQTSGDGSDRLDAIKSLPDALLNAPHRESIESIGKIFEPQLNLGIEF